MNNKNTCISWLSLFSKIEKYLSENKENKIDIWSDIDGIIICCNSQKTQIFTAYKYLLHQYPGRVMIRIITGRKEKDLSNALKQLFKQDLHVLDNHFYFNCFKFLDNPLASYDGMIMNKLEKIIDAVSTNNNNNTCVCFIDDFLNIKLDKNKILMNKIKNFIGIQANIYYDYISYYSNCTKFDLS
jgi:hypothetical protein